MRRYLSLFCLLNLLNFHSIEACTGIVTQAESKDWVYGRTMEFGFDLASFDLLFVPRNIPFTSQISKDKETKWVTKYAHVGFNPFNMPVMADGLNEKGLACGAFYFPGWAKYEEIHSKDTAVIANIDFVSWVLGNFSTVQEVKAALKTTKVAGVEYAAWGVIPPLHYLIIDKSGEKIILEYVEGKPHIYEGWPNTITNSPSYEWHETNARNYIGLSALNRPSVDVDGKELSQFGQGSGAIGLPGDFSPPSRFIRAGFLNQVVLKGNTPFDAIWRTFKILNQFDIPKGAVKEIANNKTILEETQWTSACDLSNGVYYFHTFTDRSLKKITLKDMDFDAAKMTYIPINTPEVVEDLSNNLKKGKQL